MTQPAKRLTIEELHAEARRLGFRLVGTHDHFRGVESHHHLIRLAFETRQWRYVIAYAEAVGIRLD